MLKQYNQIKNAGLAQRKKGGVSLDCRGGVSLLRRSGVSLNCSGGVSLTGISTNNFLNGFSTFFNSCKLFNYRIVDIINFRHLV